MKNFVFILGVILITGCATSRCGIAEPMPVSKIDAIDSVSFFGEFANNPGTFYKGYDTIHLEIHYSVNRKGIANTKYKIVGKSETVYKPIE